MEENKVPGKRWDLELRYNRIRKANVFGEGWRCAK